MNEAERKTSATRRMHFKAALEGSPLAYLEAVGINSEQTKAAETEVRGVAERIVNADDPAAEIKAIVKAFFDRQCLR